MSEEEIRLDQTKKVFEAIASIINEGSCSYRGLIYGLLGFGCEAYCELISGLTITNAIVELEELREQLKDENNYDIEASKWYKEAFDREQENIQLKENNLAMQEEMARTWEKYDNLKSVLKEIRYYVKKEIKEYQYAINETTMDEDTLDIYEMVIRNFESLLEIIDKGIGGNDG